MEGSGQVGMNAAVTEYAAMLDRMTDFNEATAAVRQRHRYLGWRSVEKCFKRRYGKSARTYAYDIRRRYILDTIQQWGDSKRTRAMMAKHLGCGRLTLNSTIFRMDLPKLPSGGGDDLAAYPLEPEIVILDRNGRPRECRELLRELYRG